MGRPVAVLLADVDEYQSCDLPEVTFMNIRPRQELHDQYFLCTYERRGDVHERIVMFMNITRCS